MRLVIQRVTSASVKVEGEVIGEIKKGYLVLLGVGRKDTEEMADFYMEKMLKLRIFADDNGKTNLSLADVGGELLIVSQFTLYADCSHGNRPSFTDAGEAGQANHLYEYFAGKCRERVEKVATGSFGADMEVSLVNDGPFTVILGEELWKK
ncbi:MAG: D-tyrosyl-tRNA(Tyr) deacylase [Lachnospiraceae bacterium]|nr:D-tyrosyl-tRNA(Tyr) deacylase [Lachnospiraceae bacterium]